MEITVQKYGGTSVGSIERIKAVAERLISLKKDGHNLVVVVSAMGDTTDELVGLANQITDDPDPREYDALVSTGENISAALLAMTLKAAGHDAISLSGYQAGIFTETTYSKAKIIDVNPVRIHSEIQKGRIVVVTGFQGINNTQDVTTIGRGGSDTSAVVLAAALNAKVCDICTDVDGVYTTDPRKVKNASKLKEISYEEMLDLASLGAKVLHPRSVECAKENNIILHVRSSFKMDQGTFVKEASQMEVNRPVTGVTLNDEEAQVTIMKIPDTPGIAGKIFSRLADSSINVDMIIQNLDENKTNSISFTVNVTDLKKAVDVTEKMSKELNGQGVKFNQDIAKLSIVGVGMMSKPGVAAKLFNVLGENNINIALISTSEIKVSCVIDKSKGEEALNVVHKAFELDNIV